jgi:hypothetical protein
MRKVGIIILMMMLVHASSAKDVQTYPVSAIPANLKEGMYAVVRDSEEKVTINGISSNTYYERTVITILNAKGRFLATKTIGYDKNTAVKYFRGTVYDANGKVMKKMLVLGMVLVYIVIIELRRQISHKERILTPLNLNMS